MKTKEFIEKVEELGFTVNTVENYYVILNKILVYAEICRTSNRVNLFHECLEKNDLLKICVEYAQTPLTEREEEKKYYLRLKDAFYAAAYGYLNLDTDEKAYILHDRMSGQYYQTKFTQEEIDAIKEKYSTDLEEFEQIPVEEIEAE